MEFIICLKSAAILFIVNRFNFLAGENDEVESEILHVYYLKLSPTANLFK